MNNLDELKEQYKKLGEKIKKLERLEKDVQNDSVFLLSTEEYKKYKDKIPNINCVWWLRSPGHYSKYATHVFIDHSVYNYGYDVNYNYVAVRPALRLDPDEWAFEYLQDRLISCGITWIKIDSGLYIAEVPIAFRRFDEGDNNYNTSEIRQFLLDWYAERKDW